MTDESLGRYRVWIRRPARPIWYGPLERWLDWRNGRRDGKNGLPEMEAPVATATANPPAPDPTADGVATIAPGRTVERPVELAMTHYVDSLARAFNGRAAAERVKWESRTLPLRMKLVRASAHVVARRRRLAEAEAELGIASQPPTEDALLVRREVEEREKRPEYLSRKRRLAEHSRSRALAESRLTAAEKTSRDADADIDVLTEEIAAERRVAAARVVRLHEHYLRRTACYWRHLISHHEHGGELNTRLRPAGPDLPEWTREGNDTPEPEAAVPNAARASNPDLPEEESTR